MCNLETISVGIKKFDGDTFYTKIYPLGTAFLDPQLGPRLSYRVVIVLKM